MEGIELNQKQIFEYIEEKLNDSKLGSIEISNDVYHHNSNYQDASSIITNGILSMKELNRLNIKNYSDDILRRFSDPDSHINGITGISLSKTGLEDLNIGEDEYDPFNNGNVDFIVSGNIKALRTTIHYGNEYVAETRIEPDKFMSVDIRLLDYISKFISDNKSEVSFNSTNDLINKYNQLKNIALALKKVNLDIPLREMSSNGCASLDINKLIENPKVKLKI